MWVCSGGWRYIDPIFGENVIAYPWFYIGDKGDFYVDLRNYSFTESVVFENAGFTVAVELTDGSTYTYGLTPDLDYLLEVGMLEGVQGDHP